MASIKIKKVDISTMTKLLGKFFITTEKDVTKKFVRFTDMKPDTIYSYNGEYVFKQGGQLYSINTDEFTIWKIISSGLSIKDAVKKFR